MTNQTPESVIAEALIGAGLSDMPDEFDSNIHSWRCEHPERYGRCKCFEETVAGVAAALRAANMLREPGVPDAATELRAEVERAAAARALEDAAQTYPFTLLGVGTTWHEAQKVLRERAAAPDAAPGELERAHDLIDLREFEIDKLYESITELRAERDAALAAIERVRAVCLRLGQVDSDVSHPAPSYYVSVGRNVVATEVLAALDGALEPEWEYGAALVADPDEAAAHPDKQTALKHITGWNESVARIKRMGRHTSGPSMLVRRRKAGPWLPVTEEDHGSNT